MKENDWNAFSRVIATADTYEFNDLLIEPTMSPSLAPQTRIPTVSPSLSPLTGQPTTSPFLPPQTKIPTASPSKSPEKLTTQPPITEQPSTKAPTTLYPTQRPIQNPTSNPTPRPSPVPTSRPSFPPRTPRPTRIPTRRPTRRPTKQPVPDSLSSFSANAGSPSSSSNGYYCAKTSYTANWNILLAFECGRPCPSGVHTDCPGGYQCHVYHSSDSCDGVK